jgi:hypothetical protein
MPSNILLYLFNMYRLCIYSLKEDDSSMICKIKEQSNRSSADPFCKEKTTPKIIEFIRNNKTEDEDEDVIDEDDCQITSQLTNPSPNNSKFLERTLTFDSLIKSSSLLTFSPSFLISNDQTAKVKTNKVASSSSTYSSPSSSTCSFDDSINQDNSHKHHIYHHHHHHQSSQNHTCQSSSKRFKII